MKYILILLLSTASIYANIQMAPDGSYVDGTPQLAPDGHYVGSGEIQIAPDGKYITVHPEPKQIQHTYQLKDYTNEYNTKINSK